MSSEVLFYSLSLSLNWGQSLDTISFKYFFAGADLDRQ